MHWLVVAACFTLFKNCLSLDCNLDRGARLSIFANRSRFTSTNVDRCVTELLFDLSSRKVIHIEAFGRNGTVNSGCSFKRNEALRMIITTCTCDKDYCNNLIDEELGKIPIKPRVVGDIAKQLQQFLYGKEKGGETRGATSFILAYVLLGLLGIIVWIHFIGTIFYHYLKS